MKKAKKAFKQNLSLRHLSRTKIVATLGPATDNIDTLAQMFKNGVSIARLNFSHGVLSDHQHRMDLIQQASEKVNKTVAVMADLQGQKIRIARFKDKSINLKMNQKFILDCELAEDQEDLRAQKRSVLLRALLFLIEGV